MPKYLRTFLATVPVWCFALLPLLTWAQGPDQAAAFERIKSLAGSWTGHMEDPLSGPAVTVRYELASGGKAVIEYQNPSQSDAVFTVYFMADGKLHATHYSGAGNQPGYKLGSASTGDLMLLEFDAGTGFDPEKDGHVHQGEIRFVSPDRIELRWFHYVGPKEQGVTHWFLDRQPATTTPDLAPVT